MLVANVGVPMLFIEWPTMVVALAPIVLVEAAIFTYYNKLSWSQAWRGSLWANLASTMVGIPIAWFLQLFLQLMVGGGTAWGLNSPLRRLAAVTVQSAWLVPYESELSWMIPAAALFLLIPCLIASIGIERFILRRRWTEIPSQQLTHGVLIANMASYLLLAVYWAIQLWLGLVGRH